MIHWLSWVPKKMFPVLLQDCLHSLPWNPPSVAVEEAVCLRFPNSKMISNLMQTGSSSLPQMTMFITYASWRPSILMKIFRSVCPHSPTCSPSMVSYMASNSLFLPSKSRVDYNRMFTYLKEAAENLGIQINLHVYDGRFWVGSSVVSGDTISRCSHPGMLFQDFPQFKSPITWTIGAVQEWCQDQRLRPEKCCLLTLVHI